MFKLGWCPLLAGNTLACRWTHAILSHERMRPDIHCFHLGPAAMADPNGKFKCHDDECGFDRAGPIKCDSLTCDGSIAPAGAVVDWLHAGYWLAMALIAFTARALTRRHIVLLTKANERADAAAAHAAMRHQGLHQNAWQQAAQKVKIERDNDVRGVLQSMIRLYPIINSSLFVFSFFCLVFTLVAAARPSFLWRPWPIESIAPRYSEIQQASPDRKARYWYADYVGERTETVLSSTNLYILNHMMFYVTRPPARPLLQLQPPSLILYRPPLSL